MQEILAWANGLMLVYNICDRHSFSLIHRLLNEIHRASAQMNVILIGNKQDLEPGRKVDFAEGKLLANKYNAQFFELSAAENALGVSKAFECLLQQVSKSPKLVKKSNQLVLTSQLNNNVIMKSNSKKSERIVSPFQLLSTVLTATHRKYSFSRKAKLIKHSLTSQSAEVHHDKMCNCPSTPKNRSHSAPQFLSRRRKDNSVSDSFSSIN